MSVTRYPAVAGLLGSGGGGTVGSVLFIDASLNIGEDNANFFWDDSANTLVLGGNETGMTVNGSAITMGFVVHSDLALTHSEIGVHRHSDTAGAGGGLHFARTRGTDASETVVQSGDSLARIPFAGFDGTDFALAAQIDVEVDGTPGDNDMPGRIRFLTSVDGGQSPTEAMRITSSQRVLIGTTTTFESDMGLTVAGNLDVTHTASESDDHALEIDVDAAGFGDVKGIDIFYDTGASQSGVDEEAILVQFDEFDASGGDLVGLEVLTTEGAADMITGLFVGALIGPIEQLSGTFGDMDSALVNDSDELADLINASADTNIFVANGDTVTIGDLGKFEELEFILTTVASGAGIRPKFEFSTGVDAWTEFTPVDGTNAMRNSGVIAWLDSDIPTWAVGTASHFLIRITRERVSLSTPPVAKKVQIAATIEYFWNKDGDIDAKSLKVDDTVSIEASSNQIIFHPDTVDGRILLHAPTLAIEGDVTITLPVNSNAITLAGINTSQTWTGTNIWTGTSRFDTSIEVTPVNDEFSQFGADATHLSPSDANDRFVAVKTSTATSGIKRGGLFISEFSGSSNATGLKVGANTFAYTIETSSGDLTTSNNAGGLLGNRGDAKHRGSGTVALGGGMASTASIEGGDEDGTFTNAYAFLVEALDGGAGTGSIVTGHGLLIRDTVGNVTTFNGIKIEDLSNATTDLAIILEGNNNHIHFNNAAESIGSEGLNVLDYNATTTHDFNLSGSLEAQFGINILTFNNGLSTTGFDWTTSGELDVHVGGTNQVTFTNGTFEPVTDSDIDLGTTGLRFADAYIDDLTLTADVNIGGDLNHDGSNIGFFGTAPVAQGASGADLTNSVTSGGTDDTIDNITLGGISNADFTSTRNAVYQLARKLKQVNDTLRDYGMLD